MLRPKLPQAASRDIKNDWASFFSSFQTVVLVANSDAVDVDALKARYRENALFVFFNKVYKVLDKPFDAPCLLVARSGPAGANIVYRREVADVCRLFASNSFLGICNLRAGAKERFSSSEEFSIPQSVGHLDLVGDLVGFYPPTHVATSGFALAVFLSEHSPRTGVVLAGFTAKRSTRWKLFADHDWTFEQIVLRLLLRSGALESSGPVADDFLSGIARRFPQFTTSEVASVASEVLTERLESTNLAVDDLIRLTRSQRWFDGLLRRLKPKTRKAKLQEQTEQR